MLRRVSFCFVSVFAFLLCQTLATQQSPLLGPCQRALKKTENVLAGRGLTGVRLVDVDKDGYDGLPRKLMQDVSCEWDVEDKVCDISDAKLADLLLASTSPVGRFTGQVNSCDVHSRKRQCEKLGYCLWDKPECRYADLSAGNANSPCIKHAPGLFAYMAASNQCQTHKRRADCETSTCEWNAEEGLCDADIVETLLASRDPAAGNSEDLIDSLEGEGDKKFLRTASRCVELDRASCRDDCEWDSEEEICDVAARAFLSALVPDDYTSGDVVCDLLSFFTQSDCLSYGTQLECLADKTCDYNEGACAPDVSVLINAVAAEDPRFEAQVTAARKACGTSTTPDTCA